MEWTIEYHKFMGSEFFIVSTELENLLGDRGKHNILFEYDERRGEWKVRDACDSGQGSMSLLKAALSYIDVSRENNTNGLGHCEWMIETGLPSLEGSLNKIIPMMIAYCGEEGSVN